MHGWMDPLVLLLELWSPALLKAVPLGRTFLKCWKAAERLWGEGEEGAADLQSWWQSCAQSWDWDLDLSVRCAEG